MCSNCRYYSVKGGRYGSCGEPNYRAFYGTPLIPCPPNEFCSDWYEPRNAASALLTSCGMVDGMKTIAIEFTLTLKAAMGRMMTEETLTSADPAQFLRSDKDVCRFRVVIDPVTDVEVFWREKNALGEDVWRGGHHDHGPPPTIGGLYVERNCALAFAVSFMAGMLGKHGGIAAAIRARELPNGAHVFDLGTI